MNTRWHILYYESTNGQCPIQEFIDGRKERDQAKVLSWISLLEDQGPNLPRPYADLLTDGIHELRIKLSGDQVRALYFFSYREFIVLTHAFIKNEILSNVVDGSERIREDYAAVLSSPS